ncbi:MAG: hypothetical protein AB1571_03825 [Nanoarchaeota archaeon]
MKRGQLLEQPFIYIFALIVIAFIFIFGFMAVSKVMKLGSSVEAVEFTTKLKENVEHFYNLDTGSMGEVTLNAPANVKYLCFINLGVLNEFPEQDTILRNLAKNTDKNIFLIPKEGNKIEQYRIEHVKAAENPLCIFSKSNKVVFKLENKGDYVEVRNK